MSFADLQESDEHSWRRSIAEKQLMNTTMLPRQQPLRTKPAMMFTTSLSVLPSTSTTVFQDKLVATNTTKNKRSQQQLKDSDISPPFHTYLHQPHKQMPSTRSGVNENAERDAKQVLFQIKQNCCAAHDHICTIARLIHQGDMCPPGALGQENQQQQNRQGSTAAKTGVQVIGDGGKTYDNSLHRLRSLIAKTKVITKECKHLLWVFHHMPPASLQVQQQHAIEQHRLKQDVFVVLREFQRVVDLAREHLIMIDSPEKIRPSSSSPFTAAAAAALNVFSESSSPPPPASDDASPLLARISTSSYRPPLLDICTLSTFSTPSLSLSGKSLGRSPEPPAEEASAYSGVFDDQDNFIRPFSSSASVSSSTACNAARLIANKRKQFQEQQQQLQWLQRQKHQEGIGSPVISSSFSSSSSISPTVSTLSAGRPEVEIDPSDMLPLWSFPEEQLPPTSTTNKESNCKSKLTTVSILDYAAAVDTGALDETSTIATTTISQLEEHVGIMMSDSELTSKIEEQNRWRAQQQQQDFQEIEQDMELVVDIFSELSALIDQQGDAINNIEDSVLSAVISSEKAAVQLQEAEKLQQSSRKKKRCFFLAVLFFVVCIVFFVYLLLLPH